MVRPPCRCGRCARRSASCCLGASCMARPRFVAVHLKAVYLDFTAHAGSLRSSLNKFPPLRAGTVCKALGWLCRLGVLCRDIRGAGGRLRICAAGAFSVGPAAADRRHGWRADRLHLPSAAHPACGALAAGARTLLPGRLQRGHLTRESQGQQVNRFWAYNLRAMRIACIWRGAPTWESQEKKQPL